MDSRGLARADGRLRVEPLRLEDAMSERRSAVNAEGVADPFHIDEVPWEAFSHGARFGMQFQVLSAFAGGSQITVCMEILPPGKQANQAHYHMLEEEHLFVLEGSMTVRLGEKSHLVGPGHYVCFPAGQRVAHAIVNHTDRPCRYLILGNPHKDDVVVFPETGRVHVKLTGESHHRLPTMDYWEGVPE
jgi:uncharacterized cupin superfamily protein